MIRIRVKLTIYDYPDFHAFLDENCAGWSYVQNHDFVYSIRGIFGKSAKVTSMINRQRTTDILVQNVGDAAKVMLRWETENI